MLHAVRRAWGLFMTHFSVRPDVPDAVRAWGLFMTHFSVRPDVPDAAATLSFFSFIFHETRPSCQPD